MSTNRKIAIIGIFSALSTVLMYLEFPLPFVPGFLKFDFSDLPALITSFACGPLSGAAVCLVKNLIHWPLSQSAGVGELANFIVGCAFVVPAGFIYRNSKNKKNAVIGSLVGSATMALISLPANYFITYPFYFKAYMPKEVVVGMYTAIFPQIDTLLKALVCVNIPFTLVKGLVCTLICLLIYKPISPILKGKR